jgi:uncharacterized protein YbjT (DUF2867 family)
MRRQHMILITGGTGFIGSNLVRRLRNNDIAVRVLVRNPSKVQALKDIAVNIVEGDVSNKASLDKAAYGCERIIHLVGIIQQTQSSTFQTIHVDGTRNVLNAAKKAGVRHILYQSALGTRPGAKSMYHKTKWEAEELVRASTVPYTILRPSLIYGPGDQFTMRLLEVVKHSPVLPVIGRGRSRIQPLYIDDAVSCIMKAITSDAFLNEMFEIGGPDQLTYEEVIEAIADALGAYRPTMHIPLFLVRNAARLLETVLPVPPVTADQIVMLQEDNICSMRDIHDAFGIEPIKFREGLKKFIAPR